MDFEESYLETLVRPIPFEQFVEERSLLFEECPFLLVFIFPLKLLCVFIF